MIGRLLPPGAVAVEAFGDDPGALPFPGEEDLVASAVESRRREFVTGRRCAREALGRLGFEPAAIRAGARREPVWPGGVVGSITHCTGYRAAVVARTTELAGLGIDAETHEPLPEGVLEVVRAPGEPAFPAGRAVCWDRVLFSAKESVYKAWYPLTGRWLGFEEAALSFDAAAGTFGARILVPGDRLDGGTELTVLRGRFLVEAGLVLTAVTVPLS